MFDFVLSGCIVLPNLVCIMYVYSTQCVPIKAGIIVVKGVDRCYQSFVPIHVLNLCTQSVHRYVGRQMY